jgi:hypothetical protein
MAAQQGQVFKLNWKAGLAWQRCFAGAPKIVDLDSLSLHSEPAYHWLAPMERATTTPEPQFSLAVCSRDNLSPSVVTSGDDLELSKI